MVQIEGCGGIVREGILPVGDAIAVRIPAGRFTSACFPISLGQHSLISRVEGTGIHGISEPIAVSIHQFNQHLKTGIVSTGIR